MSISTCWREIPSCRYPAGSTRQILAFATALHAGRTRKIPTRDGRTATGGAPGVIWRSVESAFAKHFQKFRQRTTLIINIIFSGLVKG